jgi:hypothetical protein
MKKKLYHSKITLLVAIISTITGIGLGAFFHKETIVVREGTADTPAAMSSVNLMIDDGTGKVRTWNTVSWHETMSTIDLLEMVHGAKEITLFTGSNKESGDFVSSIDGIANDTSANLRWQYWVNNIYEPRTASRYFLKPGDIVLWKYTVEQEK